jgi:uridine kinase
MNEVLSRYQTTLKPMQQEFQETPKNFADFIIPNERYNHVAIDIVRTVINERL